MEKLLVDNLYDLIEHTCEKAYEDNPYAPAAIRNKYFRGKKLDLTPVELADRCTDWKFTDLFIGDEITNTIPMQYNGSDISVTSVIAAFNPYLNTGDVALTKPHIALVTKDVIINAAMNETAVTTGGYMAATKMQTTVKNLTSMLQNVFDNRLIEARWLFSSDVDTAANSSSLARSTGCSKNWAWYSAATRLLSIHEVHGPGFVSSGYDSAQMSAQLPLFHLAPTYQQCTFAGNRCNYWCWNICNNTTFCAHYGYGSTCYYQASVALGVRLLYLLG